MPGETPHLSAAPPQPRPMAGSGLVGLACWIPALLIFAWFAIAPRAVGDGDTFWHVAAGRWIAEYRAIPNTDPFSYTFAGHAWTAHEWLAELAMYLAWLAGSWGAVAILCGGALAAAVLALTRYLERWLAYPSSFIPLAYCAAALLPAAYARPHVLGWALALFWLLGLIKAREQDAAPRPLLAAIMLVWANLHGSFVFGLGLAACFGLEALIEAPRGRRIVVTGQWAKFGALCLLAALLTPHGVEGLLFPLQLSAMDALSFIEEWRPAEGLLERGLVLAPLTLALIPRLKVPPLRIVLIAGLTWMAWSHFRHFALLALIASVLLARPAGIALGKADADRAPETQPLRTSLAIPAALLAALSAFALWHFASAPESDHVPTRAIAAIPQDLRSKPVFNGYSFGGPLIEAGVPVYIDGRADMYGDAFMADYMAIVAKGDVRAFEAARRKYHFVWTILPSNGAIPAWLDRQPEWAKVYSDKHAAIHVLRGEMP